MKTSPIEMTVESFGRRMFTVARKIEVMPRRTHRREKSFCAERHKAANGREPRHTKITYNRQIRGCSCQLTYFPELQRAAIIT